jgi:SNF2 family DNA or RNA helicase
VGSGGLRSSPPVHVSKAWPVSRRRSQRPSRLLILEKAAAVSPRQQPNPKDAADRDLLQAPFRAGIRLEAYQLLPLRKALRLPRVNLLIADDVGLGKTIEAGLILRELLLRRRIDFTVVAAPPWMTLQWQDELEAIVWAGVHDHRSREL